MKTFLFTTAVLPWTVFSTSFPFDDKREAMEDFKIKGFTTRGTNDFKTRQLGKKTKIPHSKEPKAPKEKSQKTKESKTGKKSSQDDAYPFLLDEDFDKFTFEPYDGVISIPDDVDNGFLTDGILKKSLQQLSDECDSQEDQVCVFFANYQNAIDSECICVPSVTIDIEDEATLESDIQVDLCSDGSKDFIGKFVTVGGIALGAFIAFASAGAGAGAAVAWALLGSSLDAGELMNSLICGEEEQGGIIEFMEQVKADVQKYTEKMLNIRDYDAALTYLQLLDITARPYLNETYPPARTSFDIVNLIRIIQVHLAQSKMIGGALLASTNIVFIQWATKHVLVINRNECEATVSIYIGYLKTFLGLLDKIRIEYSQFRNAKVTCGGYCNDGGCFCIFCGAKRLQGRCDSDIEGYNSVVTCPGCKDWHYSTEYNHYVCVQCDESLKTAMQTIASAGAEAKWEKDVTKWWNENIRDLYEVAENFSNEKETFMEMCGQQCGPEATALGAQSCMCGNLPYCSLTIGRCVNEIPENQPNRSFDCPTRGSS